MPCVYFGIHIPVKEIVVVFIYQGECESGSVWPSLRRNLSDQSIYYQCRKTLPRNVIKNAPHQTNLWCKCTCRGTNLDVNYYRPTWKLAIFCRKQAREGTLAAEASPFVCSSPKSDCNCQSFLPPFVPSLPFFPIPKTFPDWRRRSKLHDDGARPFASRYITSAFEFPRRTQVEVYSEWRKREEVDQTRKDISAAINWKIKWNL